MEECHYCKAPWEEDWIQGLETRLKQMWLKKGIIHIINLGNDFFMVSFTNMDDKFRVLS